MNVTRFCLTALALASLAQTVGAVGEQLVIYDDTLENTFGISFWSPGAADLSYAADKYAGTHCMNLTLQNWGTVILGLPRMDPQMFTKSKYNTIEFYVKGVAPLGQPFQIGIIENGWTIIAEVSTTKYLPQGAPAAWTKVQIPLNDFGDQLADFQMINGLMIYDRPPHTGYGNVLIDNLRFVNLADTIPPTLVSAQSVLLNDIQVVFSEKINAADAAAAHFTISSADDPNYATAVSPASVAMDTGSPGSAVLLHCATALAPTGHYTVQVSGVHDVAGNAIAANASASFGVLQKSVQFTANAAKTVYPFSPMIRGVAHGTWTFAWGRPYMDKVPGLIELYRAMKVGIIRYAGGLSINDVVWTRDNSQRVTNGLFRPDLIDGTCAAAESLGAEIMMQVNNNVDSADQWADLVKYCNVDHQYKVKYWELGNEWNYANLHDPAYYASSFIKYRTKMRAVDPTIKFCGPVTAGLEDETATWPWLLPLVNACKQDNNSPLDVFAWHWYQTFGGLDLDAGCIPPVIWNYSTLLSDSLYPYHKGDWIQDDHWLLKNRRRYVEIMDKLATTELQAQSPGTMKALTELGSSASSDNYPVRVNFAGALWAADILGRLAYSGLDICTFWEGYDQGSGDYGDKTGFGLTYANPAGTAVLITPAFYSYMMYAQYFGDTLVASSSSDYADPASPDTSKPCKVSMWASKDSKDPNTLKLMLVNMSDQYYNATIDVSGMTPQSGIYYELTNPDPASDGESHNTETRINGAQVSSTAGQVASSIAAIPPRYLTGVGPTFTHVLPAYTVTSMVLSTKPQKVITSMVGPNAVSSVLNAHRAFGAGYAPVMFRLVGVTKAEIKIYSLSGNLVADLHQAKGSMSVAWDLKDGAGASVRPGTYLYRVTGENGAVKVGSCIVAGR